MTIKTRRHKKSQILYFLSIIIAVTVIYCILQLFYVYLLTKSKDSHFIFEQHNNSKTELVTGLGNYEPDYVEKRTGHGENGEPYILRENQREHAKKVSLEYGMNIICSDNISLNRSIPDTRLSECKHWLYPTNLPSATVIIVIRNEGLSVLLRTVHSVINRSPPNLLKEIILIDDYSDKPSFHLNLLKYTSTLSKVKIIRNHKHEGLIRSKNFGATLAKGDVIVFLDAHCEVNINWLPPLLAPIYKDKTTITVPIIDYIDDKTFEYKSIYPKGKHFRGIFEWGLFYKEAEVPFIEVNSRDYDSEPYKSPTHAGGLLAINREYFLHIGCYDNQLGKWGAENFDLSFKVWQCGGSILWVPCSRVGHVYRGVRNKILKTQHTALVNYKRVVETWFDEKQKEFFYTRQPIARFIDIDILEQLALKERLKCKNFRWYLDEIAYDVLKHFPEPPTNVYWGRIRSGIINSCLEGPGKDYFIRMNHCRGHYSKQMFRINAKGQLAVGEWCVIAEYDKIKLDACKFGKVDGPWDFGNEYELMLHHAHLNKCLTFMPNKKNGDLLMMPCNKENQLQQWVFKN